MCTFKSKDVSRELVSKEAAITLREMGHDAWCDCYYHTDNDDPWDYEMGHHQVCNSSFEDYHERVAAPYVTDAVLWLMQHCGVALNVDTPADKESDTGFIYVVSLMWGGGFAIRCGDTDYQKALRIAIDRLLEDDGFTLSSNKAYCV